MSATGTHTAKCLRCHRPLHAASSVKAHYGPVCRARIRAAALAEALRDFTTAQVEKAREMLADGGLVPMRSGIWQATSSDGASTYLVAWQTCNCPAGLHGRRCYHVAAARMASARKA
jgi:hypothetical protein